MASSIEYGVDDVEDVVINVFGLEGTRRGIEFDMLCVNPKHNDSTPSCSVNLTNGYWNCLACGVGGDLAKLGAMALDRPLDEIFGMIRPTSPEAILSAIQRRVARISWRPPRRTRAVPLPEYPPLESHPELRKRLYTLATIERWDLGWVDEQELEGSKNKFIIKSSIAIPIKDASGHNLAWCYRATEASPSWQPRYLYTPKVEISELWFGLVHHSRVPNITIVEGALDAIWLDQCGIPALALLGSKMGAAKINWLQSYRRATLMPDYDNAGAQWQRRIGNQLGQRMDIRLAQYRSWMMKKTAEPDGSVRRAKDPAELLPVDAELMYHSAKPYSEWRLNQILNPDASAS